VGMVGLSAAVKSDFLGCIQWYGRGVSQKS